MNENSATIYLKLVNSTGKKQPVKINLNGVAKSGACDTGGYQRGKA
jgi:hypothetical protein